MKTKDIRKTGSLPVWLWVLIFLVAIPAAIKMPLLTWTLLGALWALKGYALFYPGEFRTKISQRAIWVEAFICGPIVFGFHVVTEGFQWLMFHNMYKDRQIK